MTDPVEPVPVEPDLPTLTAELTDSLARQLRAVCAAEVPLSGKTKVNLQRQSRCIE